MLVRGFVWNVGSKLSIKNSLKTGESLAIEYERSLSIAQFGTKDQIEGTKAFLEKR